MGKRFAKQLGQFIVTSVWHHIFDILSHLFSSRGPSYDATGNGGFHRVSRND